MATKKAKTVKVPRNPKTQPKLSEQKPEPEKTPEIDPVSLKVAKALRHTAKELQGFYGLNVVGAALEETAKALENGKL